MSRRPSRKSGRDAPDRPLFTPAAERDLREATRWIAHDNPAAATAMLQAVLIAARRLRERPQLGRIQDNLAPRRYRFWSLPGFRYLIVYDTEADPPHIVRVLHTARDLPAILRDLEQDGL